MAFATTNPYTGEVVKTFPSINDNEVLAAIHKAHEAYLSWSKTSFAERAEILQKAADLLRADADRYAKILTLEMGKILAEAKSEVEIAVQIIEYYAQNAEKLLAPREIKSAHPAIKKALLTAEPLGVLLAIEPWNFPYYQVVRILAPQLSVGNTMLLKHAANVPQSALAMEELFRKAGLPGGAFINLFIEHEQVDLILRDPRVQGVALTGSERAGASVAALAGKYLKKSTMELGGADAFVVLKDADLDETVKWAVYGRHWNAGQVCVSSKRMIIEAPIYDEFVKRYTKGVAALKAGDPMDPTTNLAPLSSQKAADDLKKQIQLAVKNGATATEVGDPVPTRGAFVQPTILTNVTKTNPAYYLEFFGPVSMLIKAEDEADAIKIANDSPFGLGGSVFTRDEAHGEKVASQISTGMIMVNHPTVVKADLPFGGVRHSGYGRELIDLGLNEFVNHKLSAVTDIKKGF